MQTPRRSVKTALVAALLLTAAGAGAAPPPEAGPRGPSEGLLAWQLFPAARPTTLSVWSTGQGATGLSLAGGAADRVSLRVSPAASDGLMDVGATWVVAQGARWRMGLAAALQLGSGREQTGLAPLQAGLTGLRPGNGRSGLVEAGLGVGASWALDRNWAVTGSLNVSRLQTTPFGNGEPLTQRTGVVGLSYRY